MVGFSVSSLGLFHPGREILAKGFHCAVEYWELDVVGIQISLKFSVMVYTLCDFEKSNNDFESPGLKTSTNVIVESSGT